MSGIAPAGRPFPQTAVARHHRYSTILRITLALRNGGFDEFSDLRQPLITNSDNFGRVAPPGFHQKSAPLKFILIGWITMLESLVDDVGIDLLIQDGAGNTGENQHRKKHGSGIGRVVAEQRDRDMRPKRS